MVRDELLVRSHVAKQWSVEYENAFADFPLLEQFIGFGGLVERKFMVPEDRMAQGLVPDFEIWRNTTLPALGGVSVLNSLPVAERERERGWEAIRLLSIKASSPDILVRDLSGGNAQKVTIAKWLFSDVKLFLLDEPTAGIDIGAKTDILRLIRQLASRGKSVIVVSSEFEELLAVSDRILVMFRVDGHPQVPSVKDRKRV